MLCTQLLATITATESACAGGVLGLSLEPITRQRKIKTEMIKAAMRK